MHFVPLLLMFSLSVFAHQTSLTPSGSELFWSNPNIPMMIRGTTTDLSSTQVKNIVEASLNQWNLASSAQVRSVSSSSNEIKFVSNFPYGSAVLGVTELSFNSSGAIQKASIMLNDDYYFHASPGLYPAGQVYLGDVVTHEIGHVFGMSHSEVLSSSMFYSSFSGQSSLSLDDKTGIRQKYETGAGSITGNVKGGNNIGVLGAHVQAISLRTGEASGVVSDENGLFKLGGLDLDDTYYLYVSPVKNPDSLPGYFANLQDNFCPGKYVGSFFSKCGSENDGRPQAIKLTPTAPSVDVGTVSISCNLKSDLLYNSEKLAATFSPITIYSFDPTNENKAEQSFVGWFQNPSTSVWSNSDVFRVNYAPLNSSQYFLKVSIISFPLGTQLEYEVDVSNNARTVVNAQKSLEYLPLTETYKTDFEAFVQFEEAETERNNFEIKVRARKLGSSYVAQTFPDHTTFSSGSYLPYLLVTSLWVYSNGSLQPVVLTEQDLSDNSSCLDAPFTYAVSKARVASEDSLSSNDQAAAAAGCGTIEPPNNGPGSSLPLFMAGFLLSLLASVVMNSRKKFLS